MASIFTRAPLWGAALASAAFVVSTGDAKAAKVPYGHYYNYNVAFTGGPDDNTILFSACKVTKTFHVAFVPYHSKAIGYAMSTGACNGDEAGPIVTPSEFAQFTAAGLFPADLPQTPRLTLTELVMGHIWPLALLGLGLFAGVSRLKSNKKRKIRQEILGIEEPAVFAFVDAMCHAAAVDGHVLDEEIEYIQGVARDLTGLDYSADHIRTAIAYCDRLSDARQFSQFGANLNVEQRQMILHGVLSVVAADGNLEKREKKFVSHLAKGLKLSNDLVEATVTKVLSVFATQETPEETPA